MTFSVLLPVYAGDRPEFLRRAYDSVTVEQTRRPGEVVIVRDGPVGERLQQLLDTLVEEPAVPTRVIELSENGGLAGALETGLGACRWEIVARMDADDVSLPTRFEVQVQMVEDGLDLVGSAIQEFSVEGEPGLVRTPPVGREQIVSRSRFVSPFNHPSVVYRRSAVRDAGGYVDLALMEDYWLFARMIAAGASVANVPDPLVLYRVGAGAYSRRGGLGVLLSEVRLQRLFRSSGFTSTSQMLRNLLLRGVYRLVPEGIRRRAYQVRMRTLARSTGDQTS